MFRLGAESPSEMSLWEGIAEKEDTNIVNMCIGCRHRNYVSNYISWNKGNLWRGRGGWSKILHVDGGRMQYNFTHLGKRVRRISSRRKRKGRG